MINLDTISAMLTLQDLQKKALRDIVDFTDATYEQYENCVCFDRGNPLALDDLNDDEHAYGVVLGAVIDKTHQIPIQLLCSTGHREEQKEALSRNSLFPNNKVRLVAHFYA